MLVVCFLLYDIVLDRCLATRLIVLFDSKGSDSTVSFPYLAPSAIRLSDFAATCVFDDFGASLIVYSLLRFFEHLTTVGAHIAFVVLFVRFAAV